MNIQSADQPADATVTSVLSADHDRLDALLANFRDACGHDAMHAAQLFEPFDRGLRRHIQLEEEELFPMFEARVALCGPTDAMRAEHRQIVTALSRIRHALELRDIESIRVSLAKLDSVLRQHNIKEERVLYPMTDATLGDRERASLLKRLAND